MDASRPNGSNGAKWSLDLVSGANSPTRSSMHDATLLEDEVDDTYIHTYIHTQTDRQTDTYRQTDKKADRHIERQTNKHKYQQTHERTCTRVYNPDLETEQTQSYGNNIAITM